MIAVVIGLQLLQSILLGGPHPFCQPCGIGVHLHAHLFFRNAAHGGIFRHHTDILNVIQLTEDAKLGKFGDACQEHITQILAAPLQRTVEIAHHIAQHRQILVFVHNIQQGSVVFVNQHHHFLPVFLISGDDEVLQPDVRVLRLARGNPQADFVVL